MKEALQEISSPRVEKDWPSVIAAWKKSGLRRKEFCAYHGLDYHQFLYQRVKWGQKENTAIPSWLKVEPTESKSVIKESIFRSEMGSNFLLKTPLGHQLSIPSGADAATLKTLLSFLREKPC